MESIYDDAMRFVVRYLSDTDLDKISSISRSWSIIAQVENLLRSPQFITGQVIRSHNNIITLKDNVFNNIRKKPYLILSFTNKNSKSRVVKRIYKQLAPTYCYTAMLKRDFIEDENTLWTIIIPHSSVIKVNAFSFRERLYQPGLCCLETCYFTETDLEYFPLMKRHYDKFIDSCITYPSNSCFSTCMIILCVYYNVSQLVGIVEKLNRWYTIGPIWGGTIDSAEACTHLWEEPPNSSNTNIIQIFITSHNMYNQYYILDRNCNTQEKILMKFQYARNRILLKRHSIAFLCTSTTRCKDFYMIESSMFKKVFPDVPLAHIFSNRPFGAKDMSEFRQYLNKMEPQEYDDISTLLIVSYI